LFAQEQITLIAESDAIASDWNSNKLVIPAGTHITSTAEIFFGVYSGHSYQESHLRIHLAEPNNKYAVFARHFRPLHTEDVFGDDIFIDYPMDHYGTDFINTSGSHPAAIADAMWLPHYYADILRGQDRDMLFEIYPRFDRVDDDEGNPWYMNSVVNLRHGRAMFYNSAIMLGDRTHLAVKNIRRTDFGYQVDSIVSTVDWRTVWGALLAGSAFWERYDRGDAVTLLLYLDGDYLDIYTEGTNIHVGTFIRAGREFQTQYQSLIRYDTSDLTSVEWPARAEGSTGIRPPVTIAAPALEIAEPPAAAIKTTPLIFAAEEPAAAEAPPAAAEENAENAPATGALPLWAWLAIGGGTLAIAGGVLVARRKR